MQSSSSGAHCLAPWSGQGCARRCTAYCNVRAAEAAAAAASWRCSCGSGLQGQGAKGALEPAAGDGAMCARRRAGSSGGGRWGTRHTLGGYRTRPGKQRWVLGGSSTGVQSGQRRRGKTASAGLRRQGRSCIEENVANRKTATWADRQRSRRQEGTGVVSCVGELRRVGRAKTGGAYRRARRVSTLEQKGAAAWRRHQARRKTLRAREKCVYVCGLHAG